MKWMWIDANEQGNVETQKTAAQVHSKFVTNQRIPLITSLPPFVQLKQNKSILTETTNQQLCFKINQSNEEVTMR